MEIILATHNLHKLREFRELFKAIPHLDVVSLHSFSHYKLPEETGGSFTENALLKAEHACQDLKQWVLADDSGLVVPALGGTPGIYSRRYAGDDATDAENRMKLLEEMRDLSGERRNAYYECSLALVHPDGTRKTVTAYCEGSILIEERGRNGFGYDPLFMKHDYDRSFAEIPESTKNRISHRAKAFQKITSFLESLSFQEMTS